MTTPDPFRPASLAEAVELQRRLSAQVIADDAFGPVRYVAGADISHNARDPAAPVHAAMVMLDASDLAPLAVGEATRIEPFPYVPGFLGFREVPSLLAAFAELASPPDLIFVDGHGLSHPRGFGVATHLGVLLDRPTVGVAKSILIGRPVGELGPEAGDHVPLVWKDRQVGMVLRTRRRANPVYVSVGHRISLGSAVDWVLRTGRGYRLPEPTRQAHLAANALRRRSLSATGPGA